MTTRKSELSIINVILLTPAAVFCSAGDPLSDIWLTISQSPSGFRDETWAGQILFSPIVVVGGPLLSIALGCWTTCRVSIAKQTQSLIISISIATWVGRLIFLGIGILLATLLLSYAFVENFRIVAR